MEITKCVYAEKCVWVGETLLPATLRKTSMYYNTNSVQHICEHLHPRESIRDLLIRIGVRMPSDY